jgi:hypothetical protein
VIGLVIPEVAEASPEERLDCDLAGAGIIAKTAAKTNAGKNAQRISALTGRLADWHTRHPATLLRGANETCESELHLYDRIVSPRFDIGSASTISGRAMRGERTAAPSSHTHSDVFRMEAASDAHICSESQDRFLRLPFATPKCRKISAFTEVSKTDQTAHLNPGDDGQRMMVIAANHGLFS